MQRPQWHQFRWHSPDFADGGRRGRNCRCARFGFLLSWWGFALRPDGHFVARRRGVQQTGRLQTLIVKAQFSAIKMTKIDRILVNPKTWTYFIMKLSKQLQTETGNFPNSILKFWIRILARLIEKLIQNFLSLFSFLSWLTWYFL